MLIKVRAVLLIVLMASINAVYAQAKPDATLTYNLKEHYTKYEYKVPMRDGKTWSLP